MQATAVRIETVAHSYEDYLCRTPIKFGGVAVDRVTLLNVAVQVRTAAGKSARGCGSLPLGNVWSFPSREHSEPHLADSPVWSLSLGARADRR